MIDDGTVENILNTTKYIEINHKSDFAELNGNMHFMANCPCHGHDIVNCVTP